MLSTYNIYTQCVPCIVYISITFNQQIHKEFVNIYLYMLNKQESLTVKNVKLNVLKSNAITWYSRAKYVQRNH